MARTAYHAGRGAYNAYRGIKGVVQQGQRIVNRIRGRPKKHTRSVGTQTDDNKPLFVKGHSGTVTRSKGSKNNKVSKQLRSVRRNTNTDITRRNFTGAVITDYGEQGSQYIVDMGAVQSGTNSALILRDLYDETLANNANYNFLEVFTNDVDKTFWLENYTESAQYTNQGPNTIQMIIYNCVSKTDRTSGTPAAFSGPIFDWTTGIAKTAGLTAAEEVKTYVNSKPEDSKLFKSHYKILKKVTVELPSGANHQHTFYHVMNKKIDMMKVDEYDGLAWNEMKGVTFWTFVIVKGLPTDNTNTWAVPTDVTTDRCKVIWVGNQSWRSRIGAMKGTKTSYTGATLIPENKANFFGQNTSGTGGHNTGANISSTVFGFT